MSFSIKPHQILIYLKIMRRDGSPISGGMPHEEICFVLAVIGAACSSVAFAAEVKKDKAHMPAVKATTMSDAQMDKVTAGAASNYFIDSSGVVKQTGSYDYFGYFGGGGKNGGAFSGDHGTLNVNQHVTTK